LNLPEDARATENHGDDEARRALARSNLRDEIEQLQRTRSRTAAAGVAITMLFLLAGFLMDRAGTPWFLGGLWILFTSRLVAINRTAAREELAKTVQLEQLAPPTSRGALPPDP